MKINDGLTNQQRYVKNNLEKVREGKRRYVQLNPEKVKESKRLYRERHKLGISIKNKEYVEKNPEVRKKTSRNYFLKNSYGLSVDEFEIMYINQKGVCAICGNPPKSGKTLCVDHNHTTGKVRMLLCNDCNSAIGMAHESPNILIKMSEYLRKHNEQAD